MKKRITLLIWIWFLTYLTGTILISVGLSFIKNISFVSPPYIDLIYFQIAITLILFSFLLASIPFVIFLIKTKYDEVNKKINVLKISIFSTISIFLSIILILFNAKLNLKLSFYLGIPFVFSNFLWFYIFRKHLKQDVPN